MIFFFVRGLLERRLYALVSRSERLPLIERLRANFADVVHPHERGGMRAGAWIQFGFGLFLGR